MKVNITAFCTSATLASCMALGGVEATQLSIEFHYNKVTAQSSIAAWNEERTELLGHSCSSSLDSGPFQNHAISFAVDKNGAGNITVGPFSYLIHQDVKYSGGFPMHCGQNSCEAGYTESSSYTISWSASASAFSWITGGFAVEQSVETGNDYRCSADAGDTVSVWKNEAQTAYTVRNADLNQCTGMHDNGSPYVMWSPNAGGRGSSFYCVHGDRYNRNKGDRWLDTNGRAGGP
ncbi:hypothetical protein QBC47DRAFT_358065 [Echria macrotheca]|uniref:Uncharacterized protein n=1 Tax=Echria macrotheca TaxID=438768 RepID=A0AAJ0F7P4_9PEZI|nr:hypothetical protein QBC47DRAFT_358065 [Echria macrotheca]